MAKPPSSATKKPAPEATPEASKPRRGLMQWLILAVTAAVVGALVWANLAGLIPLRDGPDPAAVALEQRLTTLEQRLAALEANLGDSAAGLDSLDERIADIEARPPAIPQQVDLGPLEDRIAALEATPSVPTDSGAMTADLEARLAALESRVLAERADAPPAATLLAVAQLRSALGGSGPFEAPLAALAAVGGDDGDVAAALAVLAPHAAAGIPTRERLRDRFGAFAESILRNAIAPPGDSWVENTLARLSGLITVRRVGGDVQGNSAEAVVARTEAQLETGDLAAAITELETLDGAPAEAAEPWLALARARFDADSALAVIDARAIAAMAGG